MSHDISAKVWDTSTKQGRERLMISLYNTYSIIGVEDFDVPKLNADLSNEICLLLSRIAAALEIALRKNEHFRPHVLSMCTLLSTQTGQEFALSSMTVLPSLLKCSQCEINGRAEDFTAWLKMVRKICACNDSLRLVVHRQRGIVQCTRILQKYYKSDSVQNYGRDLLLDLASVDSESDAFSEAIRTLLSTPHLQCKISAIRLMTSSLVTKCGVRLDFFGWEDDAKMQLIRVLLCAPVAQQYETAELLSLLFEDDAMQTRIMTLCAAVLCLRYTVGGGSIVCPPDNWIYRFLPESQVISEVPELLVCSIISTALGYINETDTGTRDERKAAQAKYKYLTSIMRQHKLHFALLAHVLWYVREKTVLHKVISLWNAVDSDRQFPESENQDNKFPNMDKSRFRKFSSIARRWKQRKSTLATARRGTVVTPPELHRASSILRSTKAEEEKEGTAQDMCCINCMRVLQLWIDQDSFAHKDIVNIFQKFGYDTQIAYMSTLEADGILDIFQTISNVIWIINSQGQAAVVMGKKSFISTSLASLLSPGELVMNVKVALGDAHASDRITVCPIDSNSLMHSMSTTDDSNNGAGLSLSYSSLVRGRASVAEPDMPHAYLVSDDSDAQAIDAMTHTTKLPGCDGGMSPAPPPEPAPKTGRKARRSTSNSSSYMRQVLPPSAPGCMTSKIDEREAGSEERASVDIIRVEMKPRMSERYVLRDGLSPRKASADAGSPLTITTPQDRRASSKPEFTPLPLGRESFSVGSKGMMPSPPAGPLASSKRPAPPPRRVHIQESSESNSAPSDCCESRSTPRGRSLRQSFIEHRITDETDDEMEELPLESAPQSAAGTAPVEKMAANISLLLPTETVNFSGIEFEDDMPIPVGDVIPSNPRTPLTAPTLGSLQATPLSEYEIGSANFRVEDEDYMPGGLFYAAPQFEGVGPSSHERLAATQPEPILDSVALSVAQELAELQYHEKSHPSTANRAMHTVSEADNEEDEGEEDNGSDWPAEEDEARRITHIHMVVNQLIEEESSILTELSTHPEYRARMGPSRDPLLPHEDSKGRKLQLSSPRSPDGKCKSVTSSSGQHSYKVAMSQQKEKDVMTLQGLAVRNSVITSPQLMEDSTGLTGASLTLSLPPI